LSKNDATEVILSGPLTPVFADAEQVKKNIKIFRESLTKLLDPNVDMLKIQGKDFIRKSGWNVINGYFNVHLRPTNSWRVELPDGEYAVVVVVEATKDGRSVSRSAECSSVEMKSKHHGEDYASLESNCYGMAETRAVGRASAAWYMVADVAAEEVEGSPGTITPADSYCGCSYDKMELTTDEKGCRTCKKQVSDVKREEFKRRKPNAPK